MGVYGITGSRVLQVRALILSFVLLDLIGLRCGVLWFGLASLAEYCASEGLSFVAIGTYIYIYRILCREDQVPDSCYAARLSY